MQEMKGWERVFTLVLASIQVIVILFVSFRIMEVNPMVVLNYVLLLCYLAFGVWVALRKGRQLGMARERVRNRPLQLVGWFLGLFVVFSIITPW